MFHWDIVKYKSDARGALPFIIIIIASFVSYLNALKNGFVYDDVSTIVNNPLIKNPNKVIYLFKDSYFALSGEVSYRPVVTATYFLDYIMFGLNSYGFHLTNIILHTINGMVLYRLLRYLTPSVGKQPSMDIFSNKPLLIGLLFLAHPVLTEAVNAISYREDLLSFLFYVAALNLYIKARSKQISSPQRVFIIYSASYLLCFFALLSKEMAITFPLIVCCYEFIYHKKDFRSFIYISGYIIVTLMYSFLRFYYFYNPEERAISHWPLIERLLTLPCLILNYVKIIVFPILLSVDYNIKPITSIISLTFILSTILVLFLLVCAYLIRKRYAGISFGFLFFLVTLAPVYNVIPISNPFAERYLYLPIIGFAVMAGSVPMFNFQMTQRLNYLKMIYLFLFFLLFIFVYITIQRNSVWKNEETLWSDTLLKMPGSAKAHYSMGAIYATKDMVDASIKEYEESIRLLPTNPDSLSALGLAYYKKGRSSNDKKMIEKAFILNKAALEIDPSHSSARYNIAYFYYEHGELQRALNEYSELLKLNPNDFDGHMGIGLAYFQKGLYKNALLHYKSALDINPDSVGSYTNIGIVYSVIGNAGEAENWFKKGLKIDPNSAETYYNLGYLYEQIGKMEEAIEAYKKALEIRPDYEGAKEKLIELRSY